MAVTVKSLQDWVQHAEHGADLVYQKPALKRNARVFEHVRKLADAGLVFPFQKRTDAGFDHVVRRTSPNSHAVLDRVSSAVNRRGEYRGI